MHTKSKFLFLFLITYSFFIINGFGCSKKVVSNPQMQASTTSASKTEAKPSGVKSSSEVWNLINDEKKSLNWLSGDVDLDYKGQPMNIGASAKIVWHRDSVIWIRITKLGFIQVGRAKITRDSIFIVNQIQSQYLAESLKYLETKYGIPADFTTIQNILLGNPVSLTPSNELKLPPIQKIQICY